jgi:hypothetical protein
MARRLTFPDLVLGARPGPKPRRSRRFDALKRPPPPIAYSAELSDQHIVREVATARKAQRTAMIRLLLEQAGIPPDGPLSAGRMRALLRSMAENYIPAFREAELAPRRAMGRPATALTAREKAAIGKAVAAKKSIRQACLILANNDEKKAAALAAAWRRRATKV